MGDHDNVCSFDDATRFSTTNENEIKGGIDSSPQSVFKINANNSQQFSRNKSNNHKQREQATPYFTPTKPREFVGFYVCKEYNGDRILGTVISHNRKNNLLKVEYDDYRIEYLEEEDVRKLAATKRDIVEAQQALLKSKNSENTPLGKAKRPATSEEESSATKKKRNISTGAKM